MIFVADPGLGTLYDLKHLSAIRAKRGAHGEGRDRHGHAGADREVRVPMGTVVYDVDQDQKLCELTHEDQRFVVAEGGRGGRGNRHFATSTDRAPRRAEPGAPGEKRSLRLELRVMADVGLLGQPNVGKSTLIRAVSRARPKVADYPFTTLEPHLGVVTVGDAQRGLGRTFVVADIPGLVEGAADGAGLGYRFLRHVERTRVLLHLVTVFDEDESSPLDAYRAIRRELERFNPELARRPEVVAMTKADLPQVREAHAELEGAFRDLGVELRLVSAATREGIDDLMQELAEKLSL